MGNADEPLGEMVLYQTDDGRTRVECRFVDETLWLSQALIPELFRKDVRTVNEHLHNILEEGELNATATIRKFRIVRRDGTREVDSECEAFAARRRELAEAEGERARQASIEEAAKALPAAPGRKRNRSAQ